MTDSKQPFDYFHSLRKNETKAIKGYVLVFTIGFFVIVIIFCAMIRILICAMLHEEQINKKQWYQNLLEIVFEYQYVPISRDILKHFRLIIRVY